VEPGPGLRSGHGVVIGGTGDPVNLHGHGTCSGPSLLLDEEGRYRFSER
jgi:hypothetical protein